jgi:hypothetical protein
VALGFILEKAVKADAAPSLLFYFRNGNHRAALTGFRMIG